MVYLKSNNGITVELDGRIARIPSKRGMVVVETNLGGEKSESIRPVVNLSVSVLHITEAEYFKLENMFFTSNYIDIEDSNKGVYYTKYYISGDGLLFEEKE
ncbi:MAG: hypothetical protein ACRC6B_01710, partial [Fusobacteriaceae bacterium]